MSYEYGSESKLLELPNPYRLQNRLLWICAALLLLAGVTCLFWARNAAEESAFRLVAAPMAAALLMLLAGLGCAAVAATRLRFFFGRGRPKSLVFELPPNTTGNSKGADYYKEVLRQGGLTYPEPTGAIEGLLYHWAPTLITAPLEVQMLARRYVFNLAAIGATLLSFIFSWLVFGNPLTRPWISMLYFAFGLVFLLQPIWSQKKARLMPWSLVGLIAAAVVGPVFIGLVARSLPQIGFSPDAQTFVMLGAALVACVLAVAAILAQVDQLPQTRASCEQTRLSMNAPPTQLMDELDRTLMQQWTESIPNRRYARIDPVTPASTPAGTFAGERFEETQPLPISGTKAPTFAAAFAAPRHRALLMLDLFATALVVVSCVMTLWFVRNFDASAPWAQNRFSLVGMSAILAFVATFCFQAASRLWGRFNFESTLVWVEMQGSYQTSRVGTGGNFSNRLNTSNDVVRTESMTLRVWRARIESVVFGKDDNRQVTAMFSTEQEAQQLSFALTNFASHASVMIAPMSAEDEKRMGLLNAGERVLVSGQADGAAQLQSHLQAAALASGSTAAATHVSAAPASAPPVVPAAGRRFCSACGTPAASGARFCSNCAAPMVA